MYRRERIHPRGSEDRIDEVLVDRVGRVGNRVVYVRYSFDVTGDPVRRYRRLVLKFLYRIGGEPTLRHVPIHIIQGRGERIARETLHGLRDNLLGYPPQIANYFGLAFFLGFRPSEGIALQWAGLDRDDATLTISGARVRGIDKVTKTNRTRVVELDPRTLAVFERQKFFTNGLHVFTNPVTGQPFYNTSSLIEDYWRPTLTRLGLHQRDARQTRHTCATLLLMAGCNPAWAAAQLGHSVEMFFKTYSKWVVGADRGRERAKLTAFTEPPAATRGIVRRVGGNLSQSFSQTTTSGKNFNEIKAKRVAGTGFEPVTFGL